MQRLTAAGQPARAVELVDRHPGIEAGHAPLCLALAEALHATGQAGRELAALRSAHLADPGRVFTLVQMVWRAQKAGDAAQLDWALDRLRALSPQRLETLLRARPRLRWHLDRRPAEPDSR